MNWYVKNVIVRGQNEVKKVRTLFKRCLQLDKDNIDKWLALWSQFEREIGSLEDFLVVDVKQKLRNFEFVTQQLNYQVEQQKQQHQDSSKQQGVTI